MIKLSKPRAYRTKPVYGSNDKPIRCTPIKEREVDTMARIDYINSEEGREIVISIPTEGWRIVKLDQFKQAFNYLVNQTSPCIPLDDIKHSTEQVLSEYH